MRTVVLLAAVASTTLLMAMAPAPVPGDAAPAPMAVATTTPNLDTVVAEAIASAPLEETPSLKVLVDARTGIDAPMDAELECMAKVVHHEAANQSLEGQLAVAQLLINRVKSTIFPKTLCAVANQPGQFFHIHGYHAPVRSKRWATAVAIARIAREEQFAQMVPGALFFHADYVRPAWSHKRTKIAQIGAHIFYR